MGKGMGVGGMLGLWGWGGGYPGPMILPCTPLCLSLTCGLVSLPLASFFHLAQFQEIKSNKTVLHLAVKEGNVELVHYLLRIPLPNIRDFVNMKVRL